MKEKRYGGFLMNERIRALLELTLSGEMYANPTPTEYDRNDIFLEEEEQNIKRLCEFIRNQEPILHPCQKMTGFFNCDGTVVGDAFRRLGHRHFQELYKTHYCKSIDNLSTFEWQHATADYEKVLAKGIRGILEEIEASLLCHKEKEEVSFLVGLREVANALIDWAHKCAERAEALAKSESNAEYKENLLTLSRTLMRVPEHAPKTFYEAVLTIYVCFSADPDSVGTLDRYLYPFYKKDMENGTLTEEEAKEYLQELFLMLQAATHVSSDRFTRGAESHFCIGGYLPNGEDGFTDLSRLILESLIDLPTYIPQVTLRWTKKTPREVFRFALDCERRDPHKRIAFQNDEKRIYAYTTLCGFPFEEAVRYTTVGCNEPAFLGGISGSNSKINFLRPMETIFHKKRENIVSLPTFDAFFEVFFEELKSDLTSAYALDNTYNRVRARDVNYLSSLFFRGTIEKARSATQGAADYVITSPMCIGITNVIDSLIVVKQFVYDEKYITMETLCDALCKNWQGYEDLHTMILKKGDFFGNDTERSNSIARLLYQKLYEFLKGQKNLFGYPWLIGDLIGYNIHHKWFGERMEATPDGRYKGDMLKFGLGQSEGRDREGLSALLNSIATIDPNGIGCGSTVTNITLDAQLMKNDDNFEKTVDMLLTYFKMGGVHFQLTYVSKEDLVSAKQTPDDYKHLRVRVSGFSDYFVRLDEALQDDIIARTEQK